MSHETITNTERYAHLRPVEFENAASILSKVTSDIILPMGQWSDTKSINVRVGYAARVVKLVYTMDSKSIAEKWRVGSSPTSGTRFTKGVKIRYLYGLEGSSPLFGTTLKQPKDDARVKSQLLHHRLQRSQ